MRRFGFWLFVLSLCLSVNIHAQEWSAQDSAWLRRVLSGKEELRLNDATRKAILGGTLISTDPAPKSPMLSVPPELPVAGPFENIAQPASRRKRLMELPPSVFILDGLTGGDSLPDNSSPSVLPFTTTVSKSTAAELKRLHALTPRKAAVDNLTPLRSGSVSFGADDALRYIFQPSYRAKMRNRKHATARYTYNQY